MSMTCSLVPCLLAAALALAAPAGAAEPAPFAFAAWGDVPYARNNDGPKMAALIQDMNAADIAFSIHIGDIKDGSSPCTDKVYADTIAMFDSLEAPAVYVPGDNEWTDCHRRSAGGYDSLERLGFLRRAMSGRPDSFGRRRLALTRQSGPGQAYPENIRFEHAGIVFVGINMPGSNNNLVLDGNDCVRGSVRTAADCEAANAEYGARDAANAAWLRAGFARARTVKARGLVIAFQADPGFEVPLKDARRRRNKRINGFDGTLFQILAEAADYAGQILLVHGDSHRFRHDHPFGGQPGAPANISRLETFGSPDADWVRVDVDPASPAVFDVRPMPVRRADTGR